jgi:hypothetical protein
VPWLAALLLFEIARVFVHLDHYKKPHDSENRAAFIGHYPRHRVDSLLNHYVINHTRIAYVCVINTHARTSTPFMAIHASESAAISAANTRIIFIVLRF